MTGRKHFMVVTGNMEKNPNVKITEKISAPKPGRETPSDVLKSKEGESGDPGYPTDGDIPIFTEEFLNYNKGT